MKNCSSSGQKGDVEAGGAEEPEKEEAAEGEVNVFVFQLSEATSGEGERFVIPNATQATNCPV